MRKIELSKSARLMGQVVIFVLIMVPLLLSCGGGDGDSLIVDAGPDQNVGIGTLVTLDGSGSEGINKKSVTCGWTFASVPPGSALINADITDAYTVTPSFTPDVDGVYVLSLEVDYGIFSRRSDTVTVTAWTTFEKTYGGIYYDYGTSVQQTTDGGYIVAGRTFSYGAGSYDIYLIKTDSSGNVEWEKTYGGLNIDEGYSVQQTADGGFIVAGCTYPYGAVRTDIYLIKTDASGTPEWEKTYGGTHHEVGRSVKQTSDGGYVVTGYTISYGAGATDVYLIKTDSSGTLEWENTFGGAGADFGMAVQQTADGGFFVAGHTSSYGAGFNDFYLIKTNASGTLEWEKTYGGSALDYGIFGQQTSDGGFVVTGHTSSYGEANANVYLIKTDSSGNLEWEKTYGGSNGGGGKSIKQTDDGGFVITGSSSYSITGSVEAYLIKTDASGTLEWEKTYGGSGSDRGDSIQQTSDGGFIVTGLTNSSGAGGYDVYLIKTDSMGNVY